ncbi:MAG: glycosyltransferase [bacterium]|nr:glycosyltransferase [bacterium]
MFKVIPYSPNNKPKPRPKLALAMIVKDGGQFFAELLSEASPWVDEIVIGDTGSTDSSRSVAREHSALLLDIPWTDDFSAARNEVLQACRAQWILILDADEKLSTSGWQQIRNWISEQEKRRQPVAARLETWNYLAGHHSQRGWVPVPANSDQTLPEGPPAPGYVPSLKIRLFPNLQSISFQGVLHETVEKSVKTANLLVEDLVVVVHHYGMLQCNREKSGFYLKLATKKTQNEPYNPQGWSELSDCSAAIGDYESALEAIDRALVLEPGNIGWRLSAGWLLLRCGQLDQADFQLNAVAGSAGVSNEQLSEACHLRAQIALEQSRLDRVVALMGVAIRLAPENGHLYNTLGVWHLREGRGQSAHGALEKARQLLPEHPDPHYNMALMFEAANQPGEALLHIQEALKLAPELCKVQKLHKRIKEAQTVR